MNMKTRFILFRRGGIYYSEDSTTGKQTSLHTRERSEALALLSARNESCRQMAPNQTPLPSQNGWRSNHAIFAGDNFTVSVIVVTLIMSAKETLLDIAEKLPPDATLVDAIYELEFRQAVEEGLASLDRGERIPLEDVRKRIPQWISKYSSPTTR
jgi:predicted transcriptional regulator